MLTQHRDHTQSPERRGLADVCCFIFFTFLNSQGVCSDSIKSKNEIILEGRLFKNDHASETEDFGISPFIRTENKYRNGAYSAIFRAFGRLGLVDDSRNVFVVEDAWVRYRWNHWSLKLGVEILNWTATEGFHPADVINSVNLDSNLENPEKIGEPLISIRRNLGVGNITFYYLPFLTEPKFISDSSRTKFIDGDYSYTDAVWVDGNKVKSDRADQWAIRFIQTIGDVDLGLHYVNHLDRQQPVFLEITGDHLENDRSNIYTPIFFRVRSIGATFSHIWGSLISKIEYNYKDFEEVSNSITPELPYPLNVSAAFLPEDQHQIAFGFEYSIYHDAGTETSFYFEGQTLTGLNENSRAGASIFQRDVLIGLRHSRNDIMGRELFVSSIVDVEREDEVLLNFSYRQRLSDVVSITAGFRIIIADQKDITPENLELLNNSDHIYVNVSRHF